MKRFFLLALMVVIGCASAPGVDARSTAQDTFEKNIPVKPGGFLLLDNANGGVDIRSWERDEVRIYARIRVEARDDQEAQELLKEVQIQVETTGNRIEVYSDQPDRNFWNNRSYSIQYELTVPAVFNLDVKTVNGGVDMDRVSGTISLRTTNGNVNARDASGSVQAKTTNGSVDVELKTYNEKDDLEFSTTNGSIRVSLPKNIRGSLEARTTNGHIETDFPITLQGRVSNKDISGDLNGGGTARIRFRTTNGSIIIREGL